MLLRDQLLDRILDDGRAVIDRAIHSSVRNLRRKIALATADVQPIRSVHGVGYAFDWPQRHDRT